jgi:hypothetical protein
MSMSETSLLFQFIHLNRLKDINPSLTSADLRRITLAREIAQSGTSPELPAWVRRVFPRNTRRDIDLVATETLDAVFDAEVRVALAETGAEFPCHWVGVTSFGDVKGAVGHVICWSFRGIRLEDRRGGAYRCSIPMESTREVEMGESRLAKLWWWC